jgi:hypothetical protein
LIKQSIIGDKYNLFPDTLNSVMSVAHFDLVAALKFLSKILGFFFLAALCMIYIS